MAWSCFVSENWKRNIFDCSFLLSSIIEYYPLFTINIYYSEDEQRVVSTSSDTTHQKSSSPHHGTNILNPSVYLFSLKLLLSKVVQNKDFIHFSFSPYQLSNDYAGWERLVVGDTIVWQDSPLRWWGNGPLCLLVPQVLSSLTLPSKISPWTVLENLVFLHPLSQWNSVKYLFKVDEVVAEIPLVL